MSRELEQRLRSEMRSAPAPPRSRPAGALRRGRGGGAEGADAAPGPRLRPVVVAGLLAVGLAAALTPAGAEVGHWIEERIGLGPERATNAARLPGGGRP